MKATIEEVNQVQKRVKIELSIEEVQQTFNKTYEGIKKKAHIKGFRPGKAPTSMIKKLYGESVAHDVTDKLVKQYLFDAIRDNAITPISAPVLELEELPKEDSAFTISAVVDIMPQVEVDGYTGLELKYHEQTVTDTTLESEMKLMQRRNAKKKELDGTIPAASGHVLNFSQKVSLEDGTPVTNLTNEDLTVELGENSQYLLLPEIEKALTGMKVGEEKSITATLPEDYRDSDLKGKKVNITLNLNKLHELVLPELNDDFAKDFGAESFEALKTNMRDYFTKQAEQSKRQQLESDALQQLSAKISFEIPPSLVDRAIDGMIEELNIPDEKRKKELLKDEKYRERVKPSAKERVKNTLILSRII
jgi:trigger factor